MTRRPKLLIVDDGDRYIELAHHLLRDYDYATRCELPGPCWTCPRRPGCTLTHAHDAAEADTALGEHPDVDVVLLDMNFAVPDERLLPLGPALGGGAAPGGSAASELADDPQRRRRPKGAPASGLADADDPERTRRRPKGAPASGLADADDPERTRRPKGAPASGLADADDPERTRRLQGLAILGHLRRRRGDLPVVLLTSREELELSFAGPAAALFADEWVTLAGGDAFDARAMGLLIERVLARRRAAPESGGYVFGESPALLRLRRDALALCRTSLPVLLLGETGTGKSALCAQVLHPATLRKGPLVTVDLTTLPPALLAAELFGTARGAFSGAADRPGRFEQAHGGTLLLDEIGNLPPDAQRMLLLALQDGKVTRLGENAPRLVDVKLVAATNADLQALVRAGQFRGDLYARLNPAARLLLPPLRERLGDLESLMRGFVRRRFTAGADRALLVAYQDAAGIAGPPHAELDFGAAAPGKAARGVRFVLAPATVQALRAHPWPGNVRELELLISSAAVIALADAVQAAEGGKALTGAQGRTIPIPARLVRDLLGGGFAAGAAEQAVDAPPPQATLHDVSRELERRLYRRLFAETGGDFTAMARRLLSAGQPGDERRVRLRYNQLGLRVRGQRQ